MQFVMQDRTLRHFVKARPALASGGGGWASLRNDWVTSDSNIGQRLDFSL
jgi:hypothetical protein